MDNTDNLAAAVRDWTGAKMNYIAQRLDEIEEWASAGKDVIRESSEPNTLTYENIVSNGVSIPNSVHDLLKIYDSNGKSWTPKEWADWTASNGRHTAEPIAWDLTACGMRYLWFFKTKYRDTSRSYRDVSGSATQSDGKLRHSFWQFPIDSFHNGGYTKSDINGTIATATLDGSDVILATTNSPITWRIKAGLSCKNAFQTYDSNDRHNLILSCVEWFRHRSAIDSGLTTDEADGTIANVDIVADGGEMYFSIGGVRTDILAKYNMHSMMNGDNPTQTIIDSIYAAQKANGTNMNASVLDGHSVPVLTEGQIGAQAYAFNGKWMITTPTLTRCNSTLNIDFNIPDAPAIQYNEWLNTYYADNKPNSMHIYSPNEKMLQGYCLNRSAINSITTYLNNASKNEGWNVPTSIDTDVWSVVRNNSNGAWYVNMYYGYMGYYNVNNRYVAAGASALSTIRS